MAFWNKSDDPWDVDPEKRRARSERKSREPMENPVDKLKSWNEKRKAEQAEKDAAEDAVTMDCPWCGKSMTRGYMESGRGGIIWTPGRMTARSAWIGPPREMMDQRLRVDDEGGLATCKTTWYCPDCEKMLFDAKGLRNPNAPYESPLSWSGEEDKELSEEALQQETENKPEEDA